MNPPALIVTLDIYVHKTNVRYKFMINIWRRCYFGAMTEQNLHNFSWFNVIVHIHHLVIVSICLTW
jgi:hypothetical protein